ncbi:MAG: alpha/beta fold hydrolase [Terracoccus sp.]
MNIATEYVDVKGGRIACEVVGQEPLVVLSPGMADTRSSYRFLAPLIADAGYRVDSVDLRGHGESSTGWDSYSHADTAADLLEVITGRAARRSSSASPSRVEPRRSRPRPTLIWSARSSRSTLSPAPRDQRGRAAG